MAREVHLVGSVGLKDAESVFTTVSEILGARCRRIPDGETGARGYWIRWQQKTFESHPDLVPESTTTSLKGFQDKVERVYYRLLDGVDPANIDFGALGYAEAAIASYATFSRLSDAGTIPAGTRFQVSLPTPMALLCGFIVAADRAKLEPAVEAAMARDVARIQAAIPTGRLALQWDVCYEIVGADGGPPLPYDNPIDGSVERIGRLCGLVAEEAELGIHLCYGDPGHKHIVEPGDLAVSVAFANGICAASPRPVDYIHMPVPKGRGDDAYFAPLKGLAMTPGTALFLGLVHYTDGVAGTHARIAVAKKVAPDFGIATECGFGRRDSGTISDLLRIHAGVTD
jgi:hypothetical protein